MEQKFYICKHCGNIVAAVKESGVPVVCCGEKMSELVPCSTDAATEKHVPVVTKEGNIVTVDEELFFNLLKYKIISEDNLDKYLTVDEGIDNKLKKVIMDCNNINELVDKVKTRRYTYNRRNDKI